MVSTREGDSNLCRVKGDSGVLRSVGGRETKVPRGGGITQNYLQCERTEKN